MEFLIQLKDKINPQTWCFNPIHKGEKIVFDDNTFESTCPECGESKYLYRKNNAITKKGHLIVFKPNGWSWGRLERKHYGIVKIDVNYEQAKEWCDSKRNQNLESEKDVIEEKLVEKKNKKEREKLEEEIREKENEIEIEYRPRKYKFNYDDSVPSKIKEDWDDQEKESQIFDLKDKSFIRRT